MKEELKEINKQLQELKVKLGIKAFDDVMYFCFTLYRKIEDLLKSRDNWKRKFIELKGGAK